VGGKSFTVHSAAEKNVFPNVNISGHRQDTKVLLMVLNFTFALDLPTSYLQNFVFSIHLNVGYFSVANFLRKIVLPPMTGSFQNFF
jgi:hypothetical protein